MVSKHPSCRLNSNEELLLQAVILSGDDSRYAYLAWKKNVALDHLDGPSFFLLPKLFRKLEELQYIDDLFPRLSGIYKQSYVKNQLILQKMAKSRITSLDSKIVRQFYPDLGIRPLPSFLEQQTLCHLIPAGERDEELFFLTILRGVTGLCSPPLIWVVDAAQILNQSASDFSWPELLAIAAQKDWSFHLANGLNFLHQLGLAIPPEIINTLRQREVSPQELKIFALAGSNSFSGRLRYCWLIWQRNNQHHSLLRQIIGFQKFLLTRYGQGSYGGLLVAASQQWRKSS